MISLYKSLEGANEPQQGKTDPWLWGEEGCSGQAGGTPGVQGNLGWTYRLHCSDGFTDTDMCQNIKLFKLVQFIVCQ